MNDHSPSSPPYSSPARLATLILALGLGLLGLWIVSGFLPALLWAAIIAIAIDPLCTRITATKAGGHRTTLAALLTLTVAVVLIVPLVIGITRAAVEVSSLVALITKAERSGIPAPPWIDGIPFVGHHVKNWWFTHVATPQGARDLLSHLNATNWLEHSSYIGANLAHRAIIFAFTLLALFFLLRDRDTIVRQCRIAGQRLLGGTSDRILRHMVLSIRSTIDGLVLVGLGEGALMAIAYVVLGVPHPLLMGAMTGIAAIIPFGAALLFGLAAILLLIGGNGAGAILVVVIGLVVVGIADHFVRPALIGSATRLPFLWVLIGILGGVESLGLLGLFIGPTTMAVLHMFWREYVQNGVGGPDRPEP